MRMVEALKKPTNNLMDDLSDKNHGIYGGNTSRHLYEKMTKFIENTPKQGNQLNDYDELNKGEFY